MNGQIKEENAREKKKILMTLKKFKVIFYYFTQLFINKLISYIDKLYCIKVKLSKMDLRTHKTQKYK